MLRFSNVTRKFANGSGVEDLSFHVAAGEILALIGLNGAGKTTLMRLILEMLRPSDGEIRLFDTDLACLEPTQWMQVGAAVEGSVAYPKLTVKENLELAASLRGINISQTSETFSKWGLTHLKDRRFRHLSLGNKQRIGLASALQHDPQLVVLDEPSNSLDPASVIYLRDELIRRAQHGAAILVSSHHLDEVARIADRIILMNRGQLIGELLTFGADLERAFFEHIRADDAQRHENHEATP